MFDFGFCSQGDETAFSGGDGGEDVVDGFTAALMRWRVIMLGRSVETHEFRKGENGK